MQPKLPQEGDVIASKLTDRVFKVEKILKDKGPWNTVYQCRSIWDRKEFEMIPEVIVRAYWTVIGKE